MTQSEKRLFLIQSLLKERPEYRQVETPRDPEGQRQLLRGLMNVRPPQAADPDFLRVQDAYLQAERYENFLRTRQGQKLLLVNHFYAFFANCDCRFFEVKLLLARDHKNIMLL